MECRSKKNTSGESQTTKQIASELVDLEAKMHEWLVKVIHRIEISSEKETGSDDNIKPGIR
jgi:hypothetical protein